MFAAQDALVGRGHGQLVQPGAGDNLPVGGIAMKRFGKAAESWFPCGEARFLAHDLRGWRGGSATAQRRQA